MSVWYCTDEYGWPSKSCVYPAWLTKSNVTWRDFEGKHEYRVIDDVIYETVVKNPGSARRQMTAEMKCVEFVRTTSNEFTARSFAIYGWLVDNLRSTELLMMSWGI